MTRVNFESIGPGQSVPLQMRCGQFLSIVDIHGGQVVDLMAVRSAHKSEWLSNGRSFDYVGKLYFSIGDTLYSNMSNKMLTIVEDDVRCHDFLYAPCSADMFRIQYGPLQSTKNCLENLTKCLSHEGVTMSDIPTPFNIFMNTVVLPDGILSLKKPRSRGGDRVVFYAEMDLSVALSVCPAPRCNGDGAKAIGYQVTDYLPDPAV